MRAHAGAVAHALATVLLLACHHPVHHPGEEWLEAIDFEGNHAIGTDDLRQGLALHRTQEGGGAPDPYVVTADADRIRGAYLRQGYFEIGVHSRVERQGDAARVIFTIREGPRATTKVEIIGLPDDPDLPVSKVRRELPLVDGQPFAYAPYEEAKERLLTVVEDAGYAHAKLDAKVYAERANHLAVVRLAYDVGPKARFGEVAVVGVGPELERAVRARLKFEPAQQFSHAALVKSQVALYGMKRFSSVQIEPDKHEGAVVPVRVMLVESSRHELALGGGVGIDPVTYEARGRIGYTVLGWPSPLTDFDADLRPAIAYLRNAGGGFEPRLRAVTRLRRIDLFRPFITGTVEADYNFIEYEAYTSYGPVTRLGLETPIVPQLVVRVGWQYTVLDFRDLSPLIGPVTAHALELDHTNWVGEYQQSAVLDLRDSAIEPHAGGYAEVRLSEGGPYAAGVMRFFQVTPEARGYVPLAQNVVLAARARFGAIYGDPPPTALYFSGGATTQRGFAERRLAPTLFGVVDDDQTSVPVGGKGLFESNLELRAMVGKVHGIGVGGVVFLDGADVTSQVSQLDLGNLNWAAGGGLRLFTIVGAIRFDVGYRLNRTGPLEPEPNSHYAFHLSIGEAF